MFDKGLLQMMEYFKPIQQKEQLEQDRLRREREEKELEWQRLQREKEYKQNQIQKEMERKIMVSVLLRSVSSNWSVCLSVCRM